MPTDDETNLLRILAQIDKISADAQLLLTESAQHDKSVARLRQMSLEMKAKIHEALEQLGGDE